MSERKKILLPDKNKSLHVVIEEEPKSKYQDKDKLIPVISFASELGVSIALPIVGGAFLGQFLDNKFNSSPRITLSLVFLGTGLTFMNIYFMVKKYSK